MDTVLRMVATASGWSVADDGGVLAGEPQDPRVGAPEPA
jgi:hypothetical protein